MLLRLLSQSVSTVFYGEADQPLMEDLRLANDRVVRKVLDRTAAPTLVCKPICDSQWADKLLKSYKNAYGLWIYRHYDDVVNSSLRRFSGQLVRAQKLIKGQHKELGWRVERLHPDDLKTVRTVFYDISTRADAAALMWYLRNRLFIRQELEKAQRVKLIKYEQLVTGEIEYARSLFEFVGVPFRERYVTKLNSCSVRKHPPPELTSAGRQLCQEVQDKLDEFHDNEVKIGESTGQPN